MAERQPREAALRRVHGSGALFAAGYGNVGSSIYYALGVVAFYALGLTPVTFMIAGLIFVFTAASYVEATVMYPEAGGSASFARHAFNEVWSFFAAWGQMLTYIITIAISAYFVPHYLAVFWEPLSRAPWDVLAAIGLVGALAALNIRGTEESARLNLVLAITDLVNQAVLVGVGIFLVLDPSLLVNQVELGVAPGWGDFALGIAVGMVAYTGIETISNMSEEARDYAHTVPRGVGMVVSVVILLYAMLPAIALSAMPVTEGPDGHTSELITEYANAPVLGIVENLGLSEGLTDVLAGYVGLLAGIILLVATNAAVIGISRLTFGMGQYRQVPERLRQLHPVSRTPYVAILLFTAIAALAIVPGQTKFLAAIYAFGAMLSFTMAHASVIRLRISQPGRTRPWRPPLNFRAFGTELPLTAVLGGIGTSTAFVVVMALDPTVLVAGTVWMAVGLVGYVVYRRSQDLPLTETHKVATLEPLGVDEVAYRSVLICFEDDPFNAEVAAMAAHLAARRRRGIHVLSLLNVPTHLPIDAPLRDGEERAREKIERTKLISGTRATGAVQRIRPGQAGQAIVAKARAIDARVIVLQLQYRNGAPLYSRTMATVLAERPCRVMVVGQPEQVDRPTLDVEATA